MLSIAPQSRLGQGLFRYAAIGRSEVTPHLTLTRSPASSILFRIVFAHVFKGSREELCQ